MRVGPVGRERVGSAGTTTPWGGGGCAGALGSAHQRRGGPMSSGFRALMLAVLVAGPGCAGGVVRVRPVRAGVGTLRATTPAAHRSPLRVGLGLVRPVPGDRLRQAVAQARRS